jgi:hypothetical protein
MLAVRMLGPLQVDGTHRLGPRDFGGIKPRRLLEILLAARGRAVPKERLDAPAPPSPRPTSAPPWATPGGSWPATPSTSGPTSW